MTEKDRGRGRFYEDCQGGHEYRQGLGRASLPLPSFVAPVVMHEDSIEHDRR
jgi:hypothetical protein